MENYWKPVKGFEGYYEVSYNGNVRAIDRIVLDKNNKSRRHKARMLTKYISEKGRYRVSLTKDCKKKSAYVHRLVAEAFIPNPKNLPTINHKDELKLHNSVHNLEWMTFEDNATYGTAQLRAHEALKNGPCSKKVYQYSKDMELIAEYPSVSEAGRSTIHCSKKISAVASGSRKSHGGYFWSYKVLKTCSGVAYA